MNKQEALRQARNYLEDARRRKGIAKRDIKSWEDEITRLEALPELPEPDRTVDVIRFNKRFENLGTIYKYAAIRPSLYGPWYVTGGTSPQALTWKELVDFIEEDNRLPARYFVARVDPEPFAPAA